MSEGGGRFEGTRGRSGRMRAPDLVRGTGSTPEGVGVLLVSLIYVDWIRSFVLVRSGRPVRWATRRDGGDRQRT